MAKYTNELKRVMCLLVCEEKQSTIVIAAKYNVPLKTFYKWIIAYNKDSTVFDNNKPVKYNNSTNPFEELPDYSSMSNDELLKELMKRDIEIARLKKDTQRKDVVQRRCTLLAQQRVRSNYGIIWKVFYK